MSVARSLMSKRFLCFSALCFAGVVLNTSAHADLNINPYPTAPAPQSSSRAEPIDLVTPPPVSASAQDMEEEFKELNSLVDGMDAPQVEAATHNVQTLVESQERSGGYVASPSRSVPVLNMDDIAGGAPQSGLYVPSGAPIKVVNDPAPVAMVPMSAPEAPVVEAPLYASTRPRGDAPRLYTAPDLSAPPPEVLLTAPVPAPVVSEADVYREIVEAPSQSWNSFAGANLHETLEVWSHMAGVELIWANADSDFDVRYTVAMDTSYEAAVQALLEQYDDSLIRPVGSLHVNEHSGAKTLVIEISDER